MGVLASGTNLPVPVSNSSKALVKYEAPQLGQNLPVPVSNSSKALVKYEAPQPGQNLPVPVSNSSKALVKYEAPQPGQNLPATTTKGGALTTTDKGGAVTTTGKGGSGTGGGGKGGSVKTGGGSAVGTGMAVVGGILAGADFVELDRPKAEKTSWADVGRGAADGAAMFAAGAAIVNVIPFAGQIGYGAAIAVGAVSGAAITAVKTFSETDCDMDPVLGIWSCCNISGLSNIEARRVDIGDEMFCSKIPMVKKCVQGKKEYDTPQPWLKARFLDDHWSANCYEKWCDGYVTPNDENGNYEIRLYGRVSDDGHNVCWFWECPEDMERNGGKCVPIQPAQEEIIEPEEKEEPVAPICEKDTDCVGDKLPKDATAAKCVKTDNKKSACVATKCKSGNRLDKGQCVPDKKTENKQEQKAKQKPKCDDPEHMDENCKCKVPDTNVVGKKCTCVDSNKTIKGGKCEYTDEYKKKQENLAAQIDSVYAKLQTSIDGLGLSVWKDAEGNFNTARLVSDGVAAVVLGTAGGLITSKIVKKNQVKQGLEDIQCYIGGQAVAGYGDEFTVGK